MKIERIFDKLGKKVKVSITGNILDYQIKSIRSDEREQLMKLIEEVSSDLVDLRRKIKEIPVVDPPEGVKKIKPGLQPSQVLQTVEDMMNHNMEWRKNTGWTSIYLNPVTGQVVYTKYGEPEDDGYIKGFQLAIDIHTNRMVARNCDNVWKSMEKRGFKHINLFDWFKLHYKMPAPDFERVS